MLLTVSKRIEYAFSNCSFYSNINKKNVFEQFKTNKSYIICIMSILFKNGSKVVLYISKLIKDVFVNIEHSIE